MENGFPGDMALTPKEALKLYDVMAQHWPDKESLKVRRDGLTQCRLFSVYHSCTQSPRSYASVIPAQFKQNVVKLHGGPIDVVYLLLQ